MLEKFYDGVLMKIGIVGKVGNRHIEVVFLVNNLKGEGVLVVTVDFDAGTSP